MEAFSTNPDSGKGFHITFANGWTVSVQWDKHNYAREGTAEMAAWDKEDRWHDFGSDKVAGWQTPEDVAAFIFFISTKEL